MWPRDSLLFVILKYIIFYLSLGCEGHTDATENWGFLRSLEDPQKIWRREVAESPTSFPYIAQIRKYVLGTEGETEFVCSAAIISPYVLLSSAICATNLLPNQMVIKVGEYSETSIDENEHLYEVEEIFLSTENVMASPEDIALIKIVTEDSGSGITFNADVMPVSIPMPETLDLSDAFCVVAGYERLSIEDRILVIENVPRIETSECLLNGELYNKGILCASRIFLHRNRCPVNAGSPLVCEIDGRIILMGIQSLYGCGSDAGPSSFANIQFHLPWISGRM